MRIRPFLNVAVLMLVLILVSCSPRYPLVPDSQTVPMDPRIVYGVLPNGLQYILLRNTIPEDRVNVHLNVFAGSMQETKNQQGLAHYLEHMLFNGSEHFKPGQLIEYFQKIGMDFGADANARTSFFNTVYDLSLPHGDSTHMSEAFTVIRDYAEGALLLPAEIDRERGIILAEKRERDSVSYRTFKKTIAFELPGSLFARRLPIGIEPVLQSAGKEQLKPFYDKWYRPNNMALIVVGDFDISTTKAMIHKRFARMVPRTLLTGRTINTRWSPHKGVKVFHHHESEAGSTDVTIETLTWKPFKAQTIDDLKQQTLTNIANLMLQNRLSRMVSQQTADFSSASVFSGTYLRHLSLSAISASCDPGQWETTLQQLDTALRQALRFGFTPKELERVKADYLSMLDAEFKQASTQKSERLAKTIVTRINQKKMLLSAGQRKKLLTPFIESISLENAHTAIKEAWSPNHRLILVTGNAALPSPSPEAVIRDIYTTAAKTHITPYKGFQSKTFPYLELPDKKVGIKEDRLNKKLGIRQIAYHNNITLNLKKTDFKKNQFSFKVSFGHGQANEPVTMPGLSYLSERAVRYSGLGHLDKDQLEETLAGRTVNFSFDIKENHFSFSGSADPQEVQLVFQLIYHFLNDPGMRPESVRLAVTRYQQAYDELKRTPDGIMKISGHSFLAGDNPKFRLSEPSIVSSYTLDDIRKWLLPSFKQFPIDVSIVGDFDESLIIEQANTYLGAFSLRPESGTGKTPAQTTPFPFGKQKTYRIDTKIDTGVIRIGFLTDDFWDIKQTRRLSMLSRVISERLRVVIREELGAAYSPYAHNIPSLVYDGYGILHVVVQVEPGAHSFVLGKVREIINDIHANGITQEETERVLKPVLNHIKVLRSTNRYWLTSVLSNSSVYPQKLAWAGNMPSDYQRITSKELGHLAKKYLNNENSAVIFIVQGN